MTDLTIYGETPNVLNLLVRRHALRSLIDGDDRHWSEDWGEGDWPESEGYTPLGVQVARLVYPGGIEITQGLDDASD